MSRPQPRLPTTKLYPPSSDHLLLARPALLAALAGLEQRRLAVVTAPTGSGKSTLLAQCFRELGARGWEVAWLSLDAHDDAPRRLLAGLAATLSRVRPPVGEPVLSLLQGDNDVPPIEAVSLLIDALGQSARPLVLFVDDCQVLAHPDAVAALQYLVQYAPAHLRLVLASQRRLPLALARLKARGAVVELGFDDLRLNEQEVRAYLRDLQRIVVDDAGIAQLAWQTEGWVSGLQMASIALREQQGGASGDAGGALPGGAPDLERFADALLDEILARQPAHVQRFLLETSAFDQFCAPLCDAATGRDDSAAIIEDLERAHLFIVRLDREQIWHRYHHLFQNFLRARLRRRDAEELHTLQLRACAWFERNAMPAEALRAALAAGAAEDAVRILERHGRTLLREGGFKELHGWLLAVGGTAVRRSVVLNVLDAWTQLYLGDAIVAADAIAAAERLLVPGREDSLREELSIQRAMCGVTRYDHLDATGLSRSLPQAFGPEDGLQRAYAHVVLNYAARLEGDLPAARAHCVEAIRISDAHEHMVVDFIARYNRAVVDVLRARPDAAIAGLRHWIDEPRHARWQRTGSAAFLHAALAIAHLERLELRQAETALDHAVEQLDATHTFAYVGIARVLRAQVHALEGRHDAARADLARAREVGGARSIDRVIFRASLLEARLATAQGDSGRCAQALEEAREILAASGQLGRALPTENEAAWRIVRIGWLMSQGAADAALGESAAAIEVARRGGRVLHACAALAQRAVAHAALGLSDAARQDVAAALELATPGGVALPFVLAGEPLLRLLDDAPAAIAQAAPIQAARALLRRPGGPPAQAQPGPATAAAALHPRELQILSLVAAGLRNRDIGDRLFLSEETVKWYLKRVYEALGVGNRTHALARARELKLMR